MHIPANGPHLQLELIMTFMRRLLLSVCLILRLRRSTGFAFNLRSAKYHALVQKSPSDNDWRHTSPRSSYVENHSLRDRAITALYVSDQAGDDDFGVKAMQERTREQIQEFISSHNVIVFMKGNRIMPQCGYSGTVVNILQSLSVPFETVDVLADDRIRQGVKEFSNWPTIPQLYLGGEFVGGADIVIELFQTGELQEMIEVAAAS